MTPQAISWPLLSLAAALAAVMLLLFLRCRRQAAARRLDLEARLHDLQRQYASSLADTRALLNQLPEVILIFERQWPKLLFANRQALELFQCEDEHALMERVFSRPDHWLPTPHSLLDFEQWLATGRDLGVARKEWCFAVGSGASVWLDCAVSNTVFAAHPARLFSGANIHHRKMESLADRLRERALVGINEGKPVERLLDTAIKLIEVQQPGVRCVISLYDQPKDLLVTHGNSGFARDFRALDTQRASPLRRHLYWYGGPHPKSGDLRGFAPGSPLAGPPPGVRRAGRRRGVVRAGAGSRRQPAGGDHPV